MSLRVTAEWEFFGEDLQFSSHFRGAPVIRALPFGVREDFFVPGSSRKSAKDQRRKESAWLLPDFLR